MIYKEESGRYRGKVVFGRELWKVGVRRGVVVS